MATIDINHLPPATNLTGSELVPIDQSNGVGYTTKCVSTGTIAGLANALAEVIVVEQSPTTPAGRTITAAAGEITLVDGGPGSTLTVGLADSGATAGTYGDSTHVVQITVDAKGRITEIQNVDVSLLITAYLQSLPTTLPAQPNTPWNNGGVVSIS